MFVARPFHSYLASSFLFGGVLLAAPACTDDTIDLTVQHQETVTVENTEEAWYPEGVVFDNRNDRFLVSSQTLGTIGRVSDSGGYEAFINDTSLISTGGLNIDTGRDRLLVTVSDPGYNKARSRTSTIGKTARLVVFNRNTGTLSINLDLSNFFRKGKAHFANDIAVDSAGNAFVTDSYSPVIYRVSSQNGVSLFKQDTLLAPSGPNIIGLNGIAFNRQGYVLTIKSDTGTLLKIPVNGNGTGGTITKVTANADLTGGDGMVFLDKQTLLIALNKQNKVLQLYSADNWATATVKGTFDTPDVFPTTLTLRTAVEPYVLYSRLNALQGNVRGFTIQKVRY